MGYNYCTHCTNCNKCGRITAGILRIRCSHCGSVVPRDATACPECKAPMPKPPGASQK